MSPSLEYDYSRMTNEDREAAEDTFNNLASGNFYQREVNAMREMGWRASAERLVARLKEQGVQVQ